MAYDTPLRETINFPAFTATADVTYVTRGPAGKKGRLLDAIATVTTTTAGATTTPKIQVGLTGALTTYCDFDVGIVTAPDGGTASGAAGSIKRDATTNAQPVIPADTDLYITLKAATGSGAAGVLIPRILIEWF